MVISKNLIVSAVIVAYSLSGCYYNKEMVSAVKEQVAVDFVETQDAMDQAKIPGRPVSKDIISISDDIWLGDTSVVSEHNKPLPSRFETEEGITLMTDSAVSLEEIINQIYYLTGIVVQLEDHIDKTKLEDLNVSYTGPLSGLLTMVTLKANLSWSYDDGKIIFYKFKTRTFVLHTLATESIYTANITSGSDASATVQTTIEMKEWTEIGEVLETIVTDGSVKLSPSTNSITVTATPKTLQKVEAYIKEQNRRFAKQVAVTVRVLQVSIDKTNNFGLDLTAMFDGKFSLVSNSGNPTAAGLNFAVLAESGDKMAGTAAAIRALSTQGRTSLLTSAVVTARNNRVVPINNITTFKYISSVSTLTENTNSTTEVTPAEETIGFSMQIIPNILENGKLILMFNMSLKELIELQSVEVGTTVVQLPKIEQRNFMQELVMESGQTAVLTGFEKIRNNNSSRGLGPYDFTTIGGSQATLTERDVLVVMLTPQVITSPLEVEDDDFNSDWGVPTY